MTYELLNCLKKLKKRLFIATDKLKPKRFKKKQ